MEEFKQVQRPLAIYAHPDDEVIACSYAINQLRDRIHVVYTTDGMPSAIKDPSYYIPNTKYEYGDKYREMRQLEAKSALSVLGMEDESRISFLNFTDSDLINNMIILISRLKKIIEDINPDLIFTSAYEGGHIDHDLLTAAIWYCTKGKNLVLCETPIYSLGFDGQINHNHPTSRHIDWKTVEVQPTEISIKKKFAFDCYPSQVDDLQYFDPHSREFYHFTPRGISSRGDFSKTPNDGKILYLEEDGLQFSDFLSTLESSTSSFVKP